jgi:general secretion pathway protein G
MRAPRLIDATVALLLLVTTVGLVVPKVMDANIHAHQKADYARSELSTCKDLLNYFNQDCGRYPTTQEGLRALHTAPKGLEDKWGPRSYADRERFIDPWGNPYLYRSDSPNHSTLKSYGKDGEPGGEGDDADIEEPQ